MKHREMVSRNRTASGDYLGDNTLKFSSPNSAIEYINKISSEGVIHLPEGVKRIFGFITYNGSLLYVLRVKGRKLFVIQETTQYAPGLVSIRLLSRDNSLIRS